MSFLGHKKQLGGAYTPALLAPSHDTTAYTSTKGLLNGPGQNNCFLNSAVQVLWHLDIFRRSFRELSGHACMAESCIFCALKELFGQLQFSQESALPPDALRRALAESFFDQQRFQLGFMDDAAECFENILLRIHYHIASSEVEDMCNARHCIPHQKFAMTLVEQSVCETCHVTSEPLSYTQMVHYVSASALTSQACQTAKSGHSAAKSGHPAAMFGQLLRKAGGMGDIRDCPSSCGSKIQICRVLMNRPEIVSVGVVWDSERPTLEHIMAVFATIGTSLRLSDVFHSVMDQRWAASTTHSLVGVVTYYGKHYSTFFFHTKLRVWIYFDDATVREIGPHFTQVVEKCRRGRYQPLLLLYTVQGGTPVSTEGAPKTVIMKPANHSSDKQPPNRRSIIKPTNDSLDSRRSGLNPTNDSVENNRRSGLNLTNENRDNQSQQPIRRSVTPSPEKTRSSTSPRRAVTPNPGVSPNSSTEHWQKPPSCNADYQNLSHIQAAIFTDPQYISYKTAESVTTYPVQTSNTVYAATGRYPDGIQIPDHLNVPRRRDSGNWSGDRNSASSSSSLENPYLYLKLHHHRQATAPNPQDLGYDSYSLSSNDSLPLQQGLKHNLQLCQIPENQQAVPVALNSVDECERLCVEADSLLEKCLALEDSCDLETALVVCQAAAGKTRAAMEAPYNNPQTLTFARMKHNACVMRSRSLHRRLVHLQLQAQAHKEDPTLDIRHSRENSNSSVRSTTHSRPLPAQHSRQSSRELAAPLPPLPTLPPSEKPPKSIEIYATLPRKKLSRNKPVENVIEDAEYMYDRPGRSLYSRSKKREEEKTTKEKRARSEERSKNSRDYSMLSLSSLKDTKKESPKKEKPKEEKKAKEGKKQHKIRRKLLMGGLIRRKNRSMPDLREGEDAPEEVSLPQEKLSQDDSVLTSKQASLSGYLSEGHMEYTCTNMEKSKLMRRTSHKERSGVLPPKVPPLPPLRTTSQLTLKEDRPQYPLPNSLNSSYSNSYLSETSGHSNSNIYQNSTAKPDLSYQSISPYQLNGSNHPEQSPSYQLNGSNHPELFYQAAQTVSYRTSDNFPQNVPNVVRSDLSLYPPEVTYANAGILLEGNGQHRDVMLSEGSMQHGESIQSLVLPPYPSAMGSANHSRQASEEFPPPPPPLELVAPPQDGGLLAQLQMKRQQILDKECLVTKTDGEPTTSAKSGEQWLKELQAKQAERRLKKAATSNQGQTFDQSKSDMASDNLASVRDLASRFESIRTVSPNPAVKTYPEQISHRANLDNPSPNQPVNNPYETNSLPRDQSNAQIEDLRRNIPQDDARKTIPSAYSVPREKVNKESDEVSRSPPDIRKIPLKFDPSDSKRKSGKKKNVTFCDEVILVATAEDEEDDSFIPNPILERVLRSAFKHDAVDGRTSQLEGRTSQADWQAAPDSRLSEETRATFKQAELDGRYYQPADQQSGLYQQVQAQQVYRTAEPNRTSIDPRASMPTELRASMQSDLRALMQSDPRSQSQCDPRTLTQSDPRIPTQSDSRTQLQSDPRIPMQSDPRLTMQPDSRTQLLADPRLTMQYDPRTVMQSDPRTVLQSDPRIAMQTDPRTTIQSDPRTMMQSDPRTIMQSDPRSMMQSDPRTIMQSDPRTIMQSDPRSMMQSDPRTIMQSDPRTVMQSDSRTAMVGDPNRSYLQSNPRPVTASYQPPSVHPSSSPQYRDAPQQQPAYHQQPLQQQHYQQQKQPQYTQQPVSRPALQQQPYNGGLQQQQYQYAAKSAPPSTYHQQVPQPTYQHAPSPAMQKSPTSSQQVGQVYQQLPQSHQQLPQNQQTSTQNHQPLPQQYQPLTQTHQQLPQNHQQLPQTHQQLPQTHQQLPQTHQQLPQTHQQLPQQYQSLTQNHQQLPQNHQQYPQTHQQLPQNHQQMPQTHQQLPQNHQQMPQNHQQLPQNHQQLPQNHQQLPQNHQQMPQNHQQLPQNHQQLPQNHQQMPQNHQQLPQNHQQLPQTHQQSSQQTQSPQIYHQSPPQVGQTLPTKQQPRVLPPPATSYPPYQHPPPPRAPAADAAAKAAPCHLCRKKPVVAPAVYCTDCHYYMSRFKPRT